jgi:hypothetical protein
VDTRGSAEAGDSQLTGKLHAGGGTMMTRGHRQEALCRAYVQAVAALAGLATSTPSPDYGVDLSLRSIEQYENGYQDARVQLDLQLRSTTRANVSEIAVTYDLDVRTYNFLRELSQIRCPLVVLVLPDDETQWLSQTVDELIVRHCAFWHSLRGAAGTAATSSVRVTIPRDRVFSAQAVWSILNRLSQGGEP